MRKLVEVWVCPVPQCGNYWASSTNAALSTDLQKEQNHEPLGNRGLWVGAAPVTGTRSDCPDCKALGRGTVQRVKCHTFVDVPALEELAGGRLDNPDAA